MKKNIIKSIVMTVCIFVFGISSAYAIRNINETYANDNYYTAYFYLNGGKWATSGKTTPIYLKREYMSGNMYFENLGVNTVFVREGYVLDGWCPNKSTCTTPFRSYFEESDAINGVVHLYANWVKKEVAKYTVNFDLTGGDGSINPKTIEQGKTIDKPSNPIRSGYSFKYWSTSPNGLEYNFNTPVNSGFTLYAVWEKNPIQTYTVSFNLNGGSGVIGDKPVVEGKSIIKPSPDPTRNGYTFEYWSTSPNGTAYNFNNPVHSNLTLYAIWKKNVVTPTPEPEIKEYTVSFDLNGGDGSINPKTIEQGNKVSKPSNPTRSGYIFKYWSTSPSGTAYNFDLAVNNNFTLYAVWEKETIYYTVNFDVNGGSGNITSKRIAQGDTVSIPSNPTREGYSFRYWSIYKNGSSYDFNSPVNGSFTLYAVWEKKQSEQPPTPTPEPGTTYYTVKFDVNGGNSVIDSQSIAKGNKATKPDDPSKDKATFEGWHTSNKCDNKYDFNKSVTKDVTLYACYVNNFTVNFTKQGLPFIDVYSKDYKQNSNLKEYNTHKSLTLFDTTTYSMLDINNCPTTLQKINLTLNFEQLKEKCDNYGKMFSCNNNENCYGGKYLTISNKNDSEELIYLKENNIIAVEYQIYNYTGLYRDRTCDDKYNYSDNITKDINLYECYSLEGTGESDTNIDDSKNKKSINVWKIILIIVPILLIAVLIFYFIRKSKIANSVD